MDSSAGERVALLSVVFHDLLRAPRRHCPMRFQGYGKGRMTQVRTVRPQRAVPALGMDVRLTTLEPEAAIERVTAALKAQGFGVLTRIDAHSTFQQKLGVSFRPYTILGACNPELAHRTLSHSSMVGLLLPCNVTVEAVPEGGSLVRIANPEAMARMGGLDGDPVIAELMEEAQHRLRRVADALSA